MATQRNRNGNRPTQSPTRRPAKPGDDWAHRLLGEWTAWQRAARRSQETIKNRAPIVQRFAEEISVDPVSACPDDIISWFERHPEWSDSTAHAYWNALAAWFKWLQRQGHRTDNPMDKLDSPRRPEYTPRPISDEDLRRLLNARMQSRTKVMILLAALAGLRAVEIAKVRGEDVDLPGRLLYVRGKGGALKTVPLHPVLVDAAARMPTSGWWFPGRDGFGGCQNENKPIDKRSVSHTIARVMKKIGIRDTPHALRHWFGTNALRASGDLRTVQTLMRHASIQSTQIYTEVADDRRAEVVELLDPFAASRRRFIETQGQDE